MRPRSFDEFVGQEEIVGPGTVLRNTLDRGKLESSLIFWGPPGCGKTSLAHLIAKKVKARFVFFSAVTSGIADVRRIAGEAVSRAGFGAERTILFVDEIHRFNKAQQDAFLPFIERGAIVLIGATTENPSFEVIAPLLSRCRVFVLKPLSEEGVRELLSRAVSDGERGFGRLEIEVGSDELDYLAHLAGGDARTAR